MSRIDAERAAPAAQHASDLCTSARYRERNNVSYGSFFRYVSCTWCAFLCHACLMHVYCSRSWVGLAFLPTFGWTSANWRAESTFNSFVHHEKTSDHLPGALGSGDSSTRSFLLRYQNGCLPQQAFCKCLLVSAFWFFSSKQKQHLTPTRS